MADFPDVVSVATKLKNEVIRYYNVEDDEWRLTKKSKDTTVWRKPSEEFNGYLYKAQGIVEDVANRIVDHIRPGPYRLYWDSLMTSMDIVDEFEENCCIMRYTTAGQLWNIISPREFVDFSCTADYEDGILSCVTVSYPNLNLFFTGTLTPIKSTLTDQTKRNNNWLHNSHVSLIMQAFLLLPMASTLTGILKQKYHAVEYSSCRTLIAESPSVYVAL
ncbi:stAR-related lipid transfer protein 4 isoform X1 [Podarcis muralis]